MAKRKTLEKAKNSKQKPVSKVKSKTTKSSKKSSSLKNKSALKNSSLEKSENKVPLLKLNEQIWPIERDIFFRPARLKYVRKILKPSGCVFCDSAKNQPSVDTLCVYKTEYSQIILNKFPYNTGHVLVLPLNHIGQIFDLTDAAFMDLHQTLRLAMDAIQAIYNPQGFNTGMNHGATAGAGIPDHLHYHIVPRWNGDLNFFPLIAETKLVIETVEESYKQFETYFKNLAASRSQS
ncbi:MAG: HIT domain-containing protein [Bdellovibrio sp.]|nr:HIT domain-containing protein [Bdellovibrio sp.]